MRDSEGRDVDFKNTVIIMTSNAATDLITKLCADPDTRADARGAGRGDLSRAAVNVQAGIPRPRDDRAVSATDRRRDAENRGAATWPNRPARARELQGDVQLFARSGQQHRSPAARKSSTGGRNVDHILNRTMLPELSAEFLGRLGAGVAVKSVQVSVDDKGGFAYAIS